MTPETKANVLYDTMFSNIRTGKTDKDREYSIKCSIDVIDHILDTLEEDIPKYSYWVKVKRALEEKNVRPSKSLKVYLV